MSRPSTVKPSTRQTELEPSGVVYDQGKGPTDLPSSQVYGQPARKLSDDDLVETLRKLKGILDEGVITREDYDDAKKGILDRVR